MYERLVWTLPKMCRRPVKALAGWALRCIAATLRLSPSAKRRLAQALSFRYRAVMEALNSIPDQRLARSVLFLSLRPHTREAKFAEAARLAGWDPLLIHTENLNFDADKYFQFHARVGDMLQLLMLSWLFRGPLIQVFAPDGAQAYLLCMAKIRPLILDLNDTCKSHALETLPRVWERCERDAIRATDGMTHRDLRVKYLHELYGYPLPRHNMLFMDVLPEVPPRLSTARQDEEIHVVSVGWVGKGDSSILRTIHALCADGIHVHMYVNPMQRKTDPEIQAYWRLHQQSQYFHFEKPVFGEAYWEELSRYDFGLSVSEPLVFGMTPTSVTLDSLRGAGSSRLMDYLLAGLGVIISPGLEFQWFLARRYAPVVVPVTREFLKSPRGILELAIQEKSRAAKQDLSAITTRGMARRLGEFYSKVASGG
ncbi:MAG: hypothetical protein HY298_05250 [Verrucomicrobia bacterium]|nr:hypothetical protein [Verrucomicrobiota bacterium]